VRTALGGGGRQRGRVQDMFARVTWTDGGAQRWATATDDDRQAIQQELQNEPGWIATAVLEDPQTGAGVTVGYWQDEEALRASAPGHEARMRRGEAMGMRVRETERFEIVCHERSAPPQEHTFVRVNNVHAKAAQLDAAITFVREQVVPLVKTEKGFRALLMGVNRDNGRSFVSSVWESAADREASEAAVAKQRRQTAQLAGAEQPNVELYELVAFLEQRQGALGAESQR
jgi:heme-degrading monooxygenase HmoA